MRPKLTSAFTVAFVLVLPNLIWIALDKGLWKGDPVGYALNAIGLSQNLFTDFSFWVGNLFNGYKGPLIWWTGQFLVPFGNFIGSVNFALLLIPLTATFITLVLSFKNFELLFKNKAVALCSCLTVAASPLFNGLATGFWIEPMQIAIICWFIYAITKASSWNFYFALSQFIIAGSLAMLIKVSSPLYLIGPVIAFWITVFRSSPSMKMNRKDFFFLLVSLLFLLPAVVFYLHNFRGILDFAQYASTSPLFGGPLANAGVSKFELWIQYMNNGVFLPFTFLLALGLMMAGIIKTIKMRAFGNFGSMFIVAVFQIAIFFIAWLRSANADPRYFLPAIPYFAILIGWGLITINKKMLTTISLSLFLVQFALVSGFAFGLIPLKSSYGMIRPLIRESERDMRIIQDIMPLATRDSSIIFDLNPELGVAEFIYEVAKQNLTGNWGTCCTDVSAFCNFSRQEIDTGKINVDTVWKNVLDYNPDFYVTWHSRLSASAAQEEIWRIDRYNGITVLMRWAIAGKMKDSKLYEAVSFASHPELLVYKRCDIPLESLPANLTGF